MVFFFQESQVRVFNFFVVSVSLLAVTGCFDWFSSERKPAVNSPSTPVGVSTFEVKLPEVMKAVPVEVWYPTRLTLPGEVYWYGLFGAEAHRDAEWSGDASEKLPLVVLSHGDKGSRGSLVWLAQFLAEKGYIVLAPDHPGNAYGDVDPVASFEIWKRPVTISRVLDWALEQSPFKARVNREQIAVVGFSLGGYTALALAGVRWDLGKFKKSCDTESTGQDCSFLSQSRNFAEETQFAEQDLSDKRIGSVVSIAPAWGPGVIEDSAKKVSVPLLLVASEDDEVLSWKANASHYAELFTGEKNHWVKRGGHWVYLSRCATDKKQFAPELCGEEQDQLRQQVHPELKKVILNFLNNSLEKNRSASL